MKAKRLLAFLLTILMIGGLLPTVFAEVVATGEDTAVYSPEYVFNLKAIGHTADTKAKSVTILGPTSGSNGFTLDREESSGEWWYTNNFNLRTCNIQASDLCFYTPVSPVKGSSYEDNNGVVLNLTVDKSGAYIPEILDEKMYYTSFIDIFLIHEDDLAKRGWTTGDVSVIAKLRAEGSMTDPSAEIKHILARDLNAKIPEEERYDKSSSLVNLVKGKYYLYGVISDSAVIDPYCTSDQRSYGTIKSVKLTNCGTVTATVDETVLRLGESTTIAATATDGEGNVISDAVITYSSSDSDVINVDSATGAVSVVGEGEAYAVATTEINGVSVYDRVKVSVIVNRNPKYIFKAGALNSVAAGNKLFTVTDPAMINKSVSGIWSVLTAGSNTSNNGMNMVNNQIDSGTSLFCTDQINLGNNALVMKIVTDVEGVYIPTVEYGKTDASGLVDIYTIPVSETANLDMLRFANVQSALENASLMASIDQHSASEAASPYVGEGVYLPAGENYLIMVISKGCGDSNHSSKRYYGYIQTLSLNHTTGISITNPVKKLGIGKSVELAAKALDENNNPLPGVTFASSDISVVKVEGNKITALKEGKATITASVTVDGTAYTDSFEVSVDAVWDPKYVFTSRAVKELKVPSDKAPALDNIKELREDVSPGAWEFVSYKGIYAAGLYNDGLQYSVKKADFNNNAIVLKLSVDKPGTFIPTLSYMRKNYCGRQNVYLIPKSYADTKWNMADGANLPVAEIAADTNVEKIASVNLYAEKNETVAKTIEGNPVDIDESSVYLMFVLENNDEGIITDGSSRLWGYPETLTFTKTARITASSDATALEVGKSATLSAKAYDNRDNEVSAAVTYESLTPDIATVSGNTVTAVAVGDAKIKATATIDGATVTDIITIKVTPKKISVATQIGNEFNVNSDVYMGGNVTVTAKEIEGKVFRHWVLGTEENGIPVSNSASYTFKAVSNVYLTAVYSDVVPSDAKVVEFYAENGGFIASVVADENGKVELPEVPSLTGYVFSKWMTDAKTEFTADTIVEDLLTKVVGTYNAMAIGEGVSYGDEVKREEVSEKVWKRDGKIVSYGTEYTYYVWAESEIEAVDGEKPTEPIVVLDSRGKEGNARMIEYDANGFEIIEAGILFGKGSAMSVDSCMYKAKSKINANHGQFTAKPVNDEYNTARGYIIYKDGNDYKVVYSE